MDEFPCLLDNALIEIGEQNKSKIFIVTIVYRYNKFECVWVRNDDYVYVNTVETS